MRINYNKIFNSLLFILFATPLLAAESKDKLSEGMVNPGYHEKPVWFKESFLDIREDIDEASEAGKRVLLYFYQDGCPYCGKLLKDNFGDRRISDYTRKNFDVIAINMWGDREVVDLKGNTVTEKEYTRGLRVQYTPTMVYLDETGKVLLRINGYFAPDRFLTALQYVGEKQENNLSIREYFKKLKPRKASGKLHTDVTTLDNPAVLAGRLDQDKPLLVMFEQKVCATCDEFHQDVLKRPEVIKKLEYFDVVVVDMWSEEDITTPDGRLMKVSDWAAEMGIQYGPSLVFYINNREVFRSEGYLKTFHTKAALDYVSSGAYISIPEFQRFVQKIADDLHERGIEYDLMD